MTYGLGRIASLALAAALLMVVSAVGPAAAAQDPVQRDTAAERYARSLLNCTRTGGWVKSDGTCVGRGTGIHSAYRRALPRHKGITRYVAWPWARAMIRHNVCGHTITGKPSVKRRLVNRGFRHPTYGENVGCGWGYDDPKQVVLMTHRMFQDERATGGSHWRNIKNRRYRSVGIGVATRNGHTTVVYDFYGARW